MTVGEVLALYARDKGPGMAGKRTLASSVRALAPFWGGLTCDAVRGSTCRAYAAQALWRVPASIDRQTAARPIAAARVTQEHPAL